MHRWLSDATRVATLLLLCLAHHFAGIQTAVVQAAGKPAEAQGTTPARGAAYSGKALPLASPRHGLTDARACSRARLKEQLLQSLYVSAEERARLAALEQGSPEWLAARVNRLTGTFFVRARIPRARAHTHTHMRARTDVACEGLHAWRVCLCRAAVPASIFMPTNKKLHGHARMLTMTLRRLELWRSGGPQ